MRLEIALTYLFSCRRRWKMVRTVCLIKVVPGKRSSTRENAVFPHRRKGARNHHIPTGRRTLRSYRRPGERSYRRPGERNAELSGVIWMRINYRSFSQKKILNLTLFSTGSQCNVYPITQTLLQPKTLTEIGGLIFSFSENFVISLYIFFCLSVYPLY